MKPYHFLLCVLMILTLNQSLAQEKKSVVYRLKIEKVSGDIIRGYLVALGDSSVTMTLNKKRRIESSIAIREIRQIALRRKNSVGRGLLIGLGTGAVLGAGLGYISYTPCECWIDFGPGFSAIGGGLIGTLAGGAFGAVAGTASKKFVIDGDIIKYNKLRYNPVFYSKPITASPVADIQK